MYLSSNAEGMRAAVVGLDAASGEAASHTCACAWVFTYLLDLKYVYLLSSAEGARAAVVGLHVASGEATSRTCACALVFMYLLDLNICVLIIERRRRESSGRRTARG